MIVIPMNSFRLEEVNAGGQISFFKKIIESGIASVEIRKELLTALDWPLQQFQTDMYTVYSVPVALFGPNGEFNEKNLYEVVTEMKEIQANTLKLSLGHFKKAHSDLKQMNVFFQRELPAGTNWLIENDQTANGGTIKPLSQFIRACQAEQINIGFTFDTGNWQYTGESVTEAFYILKDSIRYLHVKHVEETPEGLKTVPIPLNGEAVWEKIMDELPADIPVALEFPLSLEEIYRFKNYIKKKKAVVQ